MPDTAPPAADQAALADALRQCVAAIDALFDPLDGEPAVEWHAAEQAARAAQAAARAALDGAPAREPSDAELIALRDEHLPSQGESFDTLAFARAVRAWPCTGDRNA